MDAVDVYHMLKPSTQSLKTLLSSIFIQISHSRESINGQHKRHPYISSPPDFLLGTQLRRNESLHSAVVDFQKVNTIVLGTEHALDGWMDVQ